MSDRQTIVSRLIADRDFRADYIRAKLEILIPSQLRALRLRQGKTQPELAEMAGMKQSRISAMETPGKVNFNQETLVRMAATLNVGMKVEFVPVSEMLAWENSYSQDTFNVTPLADDVDFLEPVRRIERKHRVKRSSNTRRTASRSEITTMPLTSQQGAQLNFDFTQTESQVPNLPASVITLPTRTYAVNKMLAAAVGGAGGTYGR